MARVLSATQAATFIERESADLTSRRAYQVFILEKRCPVFSVLQVTRKLDLGEEPPDISIFWLLSRVFNIIKPLKHLPPASYPQVRFMPSMEHISCIWEQS